MLYEVITSFFVTLSGPRDGGFFILQDPSNFVSPPAKPGVYLVITSYSIHYTKLYDFPDGGREAWHLFNKDTYLIQSIFSFVHGDR